MDIGDIQRLALQARSFEHPLDGGRIVVQLVLPTPHDAEVAALRGQFTPSGAPDAAAPVRAMRDLLQQAIVGWSGVQAKDLLPAKVAESIAPEEAASEGPWGPATVPLLLNNKPAWATELQRAMFDRLAERDGKRKAVAKNSASASPGRSPKPRRASSKRGA